MNAIAPHPLFTMEDSAPVSPLPARTPMVRFDPPSSTASAAAISPWRSPLFYLSFIAGALLLVAVGLILAWRITLRAPHERSSPVRAATAASPA